MKRAITEALTLTGELVRDVPAERRSRSEARRRTTQRRREFQQDALARGVHPATGSPLLADSALRCRDCVHAVAAHHARTYWKCERSSLSRSEATDIRVGWPACSQFEPRGDR